MALKSISLQMLSAAKKYQQKHAITVGADIFSMNLVNLEQFWLGNKYIWLMLKSISLQMLNAAKKTQQKHVITNQFGFTHTDYLFWFISCTFTRFTLVSYKYGWSVIFSNIWQSKCNSYGHAFTNQQKRFYLVIVKI